MGGAEILQFFQIDGFQHLPELPDRIVEQPWQSVNELTAEFGHKVTGTSCSNVEG